MGYSGKKMPTDIGASYQLASANQKGYFVPPTILTNVPDDDSLFTDEIFGPVTAITKFSSDDEGNVKSQRDTLRCLSDEV